MNSSSKLILIKSLHSLVWAMFALAIVLIPLATYSGELRVSLALIGFVMLEVAVLAANHFKCPLTSLAERYTTQRQDNFDIYLPLFLARYNKQIFGSLFLAGMAYTAIVWLLPGN